MERAAYLVKLSRPRFWFYLAGPIIVGVVYGVLHAGGGPADLFTVATLAMLGYFLVPANIYLYGINDLFDADVDEDNPKKDRKEVRYSGQGYVPIVVVVCGLGLLALFPLVDPIAWPWLLLYGLLATEYSAPPFRFKTTPYLDSVSNGLYVLPGAAAYATVAGAHPPIAAVVGGWLWAMAMHTFSAIPDIEPDRHAGIRTTATELGERGTYAYCFAIWALAAGAFAVYDVRAGGLLGIYPALVAGVAVSDIAVDRAYWWYPLINTGLGAVLTLWALVHLIPPAELLA